MEGHLPERPASGDPAAQDPSRLRISDEDRHKVAEVLRQAAGEGRIDLQELDERLEATFAAKTYGDLVPITVDLPVAGGTPAPAPAPAPAARGALAGYPTTIAVMSDTKRLGRWRVEPTQNAVAFMGSVTLDLREAVFAAQEVVVNASAVMGEVKIVVDAHTAVVVEGVGVMGEYSEQRARVASEVGPDSPVVRVRGVALMGSVHVQRKAPPRQALRRRLGWAGP